ncbi:MAG: sigma-54 dependent transcriptional regulator [Thermodesulfobacteriota bacterium]|nr:MAG: sigma-54 dependent transcriptional regulator [Thermodesulfobacteriota bacterium]
MAMERKKAKSRIVVVDDEKDMRTFFDIMLRKEGYDVTSFPSGDRAIEYLRGNDFDLVISDIRMPGMDGVELLKEVKDLDADVPVIMITAYASVDTAIDAMKAGAFDYFTKPFNVDEIKLNIKKAIEHLDLKKENRSLKEDIKARWGLTAIIGESPAMAEVFNLVRSVAATKANVFITGESGTGKELVARAVHYEVDGGTAPFVAINCGAIPENLIESELFGHTRGSFTGAVAEKLGLVEQADGGTLFLDEITEMPQHLQVKLLRFLQERNFRRVGGTEDISVDLRIIAASNKDIDEEVRAGRFRDDLFYRLNVIRIVVPPLRQRKEDIPLLAGHFIQKFSKAHGKEIKRISKEAIKTLVSHTYPGNIRELENLIERAVTLEPSDTLTRASLPPYLAPGADGPGGDPYIMKIPGEGMDLEKTIEEFERAVIADALKKAGGVKKKAAQLLGLSFRSMRYKLSKYDIQEE